MMKMMTMMMMMMMDDDDDDDDDDDGDNDGRQLLLQLHERLTIDYCLMALWRKSFHPRCSSSCLAFLDGNVYLDRAGDVRECELEPQWQSE